MKHLACGVVAVALLFGFPVLAHQGDPPNPHPELISDTASYRHFFLNFFLHVNYMLENDPPTPAGMVPQMTPQQHCDKYLELMGFNSNDIRKIETAAVNWKKAFFEENGEFMSLPEDQRQGQIQREHSARLDKITNDAAESLSRALDDSALLNAQIQSQKKHMDTSEQLRQTQPQHRP